ncbi:MAG: nicotianamine synthase family protein [Actinomycetota bacterium]
MLRTVVGGSARAPTPASTTANGRSIFDRLGPALLRVYLGDPDALAPSPSVNATFGDLVSLLVSPGVDVDAVKQACLQLEATPHLRRRARAVKRSAAIAETAMERAHARQLLELDPVDDGTPIDRLRSILRDYPYLGNYEQLVGSEIEAITPRRTPGPVAFCGAGPLPLTGVLWNLSTGESVTLVEKDERAAELARAVVDRLVALGITAPSGLRVVTADAATVPVDGYRVIVVASLVPGPAMTDLAERLVASADRPLLAVRSAVGLTARFAYDNVAVGAVTALGLRHLGTIAPAHTLAERPIEPCVAVGAGDPKLLEVAPAGVLNTTELFE